ncbi:MAG TPA: TIGR01212 family radical SAM protein [Firmicutes bacterium]|nr:TIGR01212 family radical SAM protein [Bacillota bacterium]
MSGHSSQRDTNPFPYSDSNKRYYTYDYFLRQKFGQKCAKLPVDAGFTCPNRDGSRGFGGCIYCSERGSGDFCNKNQTITEQLESSFKMMRQKWAGALGIAYFQAFTNTYAPCDVLRSKYEEALRVPDIVGLDIATRADCLEQSTVEYLAELAERTYLTVELGLQTVHDRTAKIINRGHTFAEFLDGYTRLRNASPKINIAVHLINGLPNEDTGMMLESARKVASLRPDMVKLHLLYIVEGTRLCELYRAGEVDCLTLDEYTDILVGQLELLPPETVIGRVTGDAPGDSLSAPLWSKKKLVVMNTLDQKLYERNTWQGRLQQQRL